MELLVLDVVHVAYPPGRPALWYIFGPLVDPRTYLRALHLLAMFPAGIAYFVAIVVLMSLGGSLVWTLLGPPILIAQLYLSRWAGDAEAWSVRHVAAIELRRPPTTIERGQSFRGQLKTHLLDPTTWTGLLYLVAQFPIGIAVFVVLVVMLSLGGAFTLGPLIVDLGGAADINGGWVLDTPSEPWQFVPLGLVILLASVHAIVLMSVTHAAWARTLLGSRAPAHRAAAADARPPRPPVWPRTRRGASGTSRP